MSQEINGQIDSLENNEEVPQMCDMCQIIPDQYISLKCSHNICLSCIIQLYQKSENNPPGLILCPFDQIDTILDEYSIMALQKMIEEAQNNDNNQENLNNEGVQINENNDENNLNHENPLVKSNEDYLFEPFSQYKEKTQEANKKMKNETVEPKKPEDTHNSTPKTQKTDSQYKRINNDKPNYANNKDFNINDKNYKENKAGDRFREMKEYQSLPTLIFPFCQKHRKETANIYCFTCDIGLLCIECLVDGSHDLHEVKNLGQNLDLIRVKNANLAEKLQKKKKEISQRVSELGSKSKIIKNKINEAKKQIFNDFKEIKEKIELKEKELIKRSEEYSNEKISEIDEEITVLKEKYKLLNSMEEKNRLIFQNREDSPEKIMKIYSSLKKGFEKFDFKTKTIEEIPDFKCYLNMESFYKYLENIQILKLEISSISTKKTITPPYQIPKNPSKSYLLYNSNEINTSFMDKHDNGLLENEDIEFKKKTLHEKHKKLPEYAIDKRKFVYIRPNYDCMPGKNSFCAVNKSTTSFVNDHFRDENRISGDFLKKMNELGVSRIEERMFHKSKGMTLGNKHRLMSSLEKQKSLFEKNKNVI